MIAGAWYIGPAASAVKVISGGALSFAANTGYQYYDLNQTGNENKTWDYKGSATSFTTGMLAPGRGLTANAGIAIAGTLFTDGFDKGAIIGSSAGWIFGTTVNMITPPIFNPVLGPSSGPIGDVIGTVGGEFISNAVKDGINEKKK